MKNPLDAPTPDRAEGKLDATQVRLQNERLLLNLIWSERAISRAEIARVTGLSRSTVSAIVEDLLETGLISFRGAGESQGGRPPVILGFEDDALALVGVDLGASHVSVIVTNLRGEARAWRTRNHNVRPDPEGSLALVDELIGEALYDAGMSDERLVGIGVGVPSPVNPKHPGKVSPLVMPRWRDVNITARLGEVHSCPVLVDNDANLGALAELWWGKGVGARDLVFIKVGTGIGCGHIIHGDIYRGATGVAGEIGHLTLDPNGPPCVCGLTGCLAT
ncbi:MAG TPA: ROK family protein, partial [Myxococcota bacterium]|nr:ROK family protein [Myxococcota bacterium]